MRLKDFLRLTDTEFLEYLKKINFNTHVATNKIFKSGGNVYDILGITDLYSRDIKIIKKNNRVDMFFSLMPNHDFGIIQIISLRKFQGGAIYIFYNTFGEPQGCRMAKYLNCGTSTMKVHSIKEILEDAGV